ncbi:signal peptidase II [Marinitoga aeolica]|uniref:Lipoprotein signal peptidase n=1 Tax=Marinitoga aeolica TaxID=2809031 RepID=A0ABY8PSD6_9BACT|nr:signal peptidase II [Marinitoga aeolica]WGS65423.1 signal peptidase II [Marinitoga aeolica]
MDWLIPFILVFDQISKKLAQEYLAGKTIHIIGDFLTLSYVTNTGIAFGMLQGHPFLMGIIATFVVTIIYVYRKIHLKQHKSFLFDLSTVFIIGGALGNIYDRIRIEYVVDMFSVKYFSVFNVADSFVTIGGILLAVYYLKRSNDPWKKTF